jgi:hypothetical protein
MTFYLKISIAILVLSLTFLLFEAESRAEAKLLTAVSTATNSIHKWSDEYATRVSDMIQNNAYPINDGYRECAEVAELPGTIVCLNRSKGGIAATLARAQIYAEGAGAQLTGRALAKHTLLLNESSEVNTFAQVYNGADIDSKDLLTFYAAVNAACAAAPGTRVCLSSAEKDFYTNIVQPTSFLKSKKDFVVISIVVGDYDVGSHELLHAQYFLNPTYRKTVDDLWSLLSESSRTEIRAALASNYDKSDETLMKNEFQAYVLQTGGEYAALKQFVARYHDVLVVGLRQNGIELIPFQ